MTRQAPTRPRRLFLAEQADTSHLIWLYTFNTSKPGFDGSWLENAAKKAGAYESYSLQQMAPDTVLVITPTATDELFRASDTALLVDDYFLQLEILRGDMFGTTPLLQVDFLTSVLQGLRQWKAEHDVDHQRKRSHSSELGIDPYGTTCLAVFADYDTAISALTPTQAAATRSMPFPPHGYSADASIRATQTERAQAITQLPDGRCLARVDLGTGDRQPWPEFTFMAECLWRFYMGEVQCLKQRNLINDLGDIWEVSSRLKPISPYLVLAEDSL